MSIRFVLEGPFQGLPSLEPVAGPSLEPEETSPWDSEDQLPSLAPSYYGSLEGVGGPFRGLPSFGGRISHEQDLPLHQQSVVQKTKKAFLKARRNANLSPDELIARRNEAAQVIAAANARSVVWERIGQSLAIFTDRCKELEPIKQALATQALATTIAPMNPEQQLQLASLSNLASSLGSASQEIETYLQESSAYVARFEKFTSIQDDIETIESTHPEQQLRLALLSYQSYRLRCHL